MYIDYSSALEMSGLDTLYSRRTKTSLDFALKCVKHQRNRRLFPLNSNVPACKTRYPEKYIVNFARTNAYRDSTIPFCQKLLNRHHQDKTQWFSEAEKHTYNVKQLLQWIIVLYKIYHSNLRHHNKKPSYIYISSQSFSYHY